MLPCKAMSTLVNQGTNFDPVPPTTYACFTQPMEPHEHGSDLIAPEALERSIVALPEVRAARVVATTSGRITEIHLIAEGGKAPKQLVRDVQTLAQANFSIDIDHRIVSVVTFADDDLAVSTAPKVRLASLSWTTELTRTTCRVRLDSAGETTIGESTGPATASGRARAASEATLQALGDLTGQEPLADVPEVRFLDVAGHRIAVVLLILLRADTNETILAGSSTTRGDDGEAVVGAILDAYNRRTQE